MMISCASKLDPNVTQLRLHTIHHYRYSFRHVWLNLFLTRHRELRCQDKRVNDPGNPMLFLHSVFLNTRSHVWHCYVTSWLVFIFQYVFHTCTYFWRVVTKIEITADFVFTRMEEKNWIFSCTLFIQWLYFVSTTWRSRIISRDHRSIDSDDYFLPFSLEPRIEHDWWLHSLHFRSDFFWHVIRT